MSERQALVLVPGLSCDRHVWQAQIAGLSDMADISIGDTLKDDSIPLMASRVLDAAPERFAIAGFSMGGYVAMEIWRRAPERVTRLALVDTNARADTQPQAELRRAAIRTAQARGFEHVLRGSLRQLVAPDCPEALFEEVVQMALRVGFGTYMDQQAAIIDRADSLATLGTITVPAMVMVGAADALTPPHLAEEMAQAMASADVGSDSGAAYEVIADAGHMAPMEQPDAVNAAFRRWLMR
ncbi:pimeloyl-ACP methyl ester carboxylesterase [Novosphingobium sp. PhB55]|uniref:alpha/beta fold hydrolase n=1 Tax=Novosphingobium sp. PhB55 TaxID=2485106 RepID=UPI001065677C|nr:alpha/beta fold hydrolase [Novosphingobium sp. PhB55]TDW64977.1 pimeloyl-ACP methyl ester carboxylesterase [Novosphingobium sp. PhB55]